LGFSVDGLPGGGNFTRIPGKGANVVETIKKINKRNTQSINGAIFILGCSL
jgi:hypothetical protein